MNRRWITSLVSVCAVAVLPPRVLFAQSSTAAAVQLFDEAREALKRGDLAMACAKFGESNRIDPAVGTAFNLANCEEERGRLATAWALFRQVAARMKTDDPRLSVAHARIAALEPRVPRVVLVASDRTPPGTRVRLDELELVGASFGSAIPVDPGTHSVVVRSPGATPRSSSLNVAEGTTISLPIDPPLTSMAPGPDRASDGTVLGMTRKQALWASAGIGAGGLLLGMMTGAIGLNAQSIGDANCSDVEMKCTKRGYDANQRAKAMATVSTMGFAVGILGAGAATYVYLAVPAEDEWGTRAAAIGLRGAW